MMVSAPVLSAGVLDKRRRVDAGVTSSAVVDAPGVLDMHLLVDGVDLDFVDACVLDDDAAGRE
jgi:hypothetical protein